MEIVLYFPSSPESLQTLRRTAAAVYAEAAFLYLQKLRCPLRQKFLLLERAEKEIAFLQTEPECGG